MCEGFPTTQLQTCSPGRAETLTQFPAYLGCSSLAESFPRGGWGDIPSARVATQNIIVYPAGFHIAPHIRSLLLVHFKAAFFSLRGLLSVVLGSQASKHHRDSNYTVWLLLACYYWPIPRLLPAQTCFSLCQIDPRSSFMQSLIPDQVAPPPSACVGQDLLPDKQTVKTHQGCVLRICFLPNIWETFTVPEWYFSNSCFLLLL